MDMSTCVSMNYHYTKVFIEGIDFIQRDMIIEKLILKGSLNRKLETI